MSEFRRYDEVSDGDFYPEQPLNFIVNKAVVDGFLKATQNDGAFYDSSENGQRRAPSMIASVYLIDLLMARKSPPGGIHAKQSLRFWRSLVVGEVLTIQARVVEKSIRKERPYVVSDFEARGADGALAATGRITSIWGKDQ